MDCLGSPVGSPVAKMAHVTRKKTVIFQFANMNLPGNHSKHLATMDMIYMIQIHTGSSISICFTRAISMFHVVSILGVQFRLPLYPFQVGDGLDSW